MNFIILKTEAELKAWLKKQTTPIHFVPTMGGLHEGHTELIKTAKCCDSKNKPSVLVSIFINPLQFGENEDFEQYPRDFNHDSQVALDAGANAVWVPTADQIYPGGSEKNFQIQAPYYLTSKLCGSSRKGHFDGVATVILRLLTLVKPQLLILGEKDWQQLIIIRQLITDLNLPTKIKSVGTVRENDGLPFSSRNRYLSVSERLKAKSLPTILFKTALKFKEGEKINLQKIATYLRNNDLKVDYLKHVDPYCLNEVDNEKEFSLLACAVHCGKTRLIDHTFLMSRKPIIAIDGPAGAGKSTVTRAFAEKLGLLYLDTGAMYRAVTWLFQKENINLNNQKEIESMLNLLDLDLKLNSSGKQKVIVNQTDVTDAIRSPEVTSQVSIVSANSLVRENLTAHQKLLGKAGGLVAEGRDIGTAVFPDAELKVFLTASPQERAKRRSIDLKSKGFNVPDLKDLECQIKERDQLDMNRKISPLLKAKDSIELITDGMNIEEVVATLIDMFYLKIPKEIWPNK